MAASIRPAKRSMGCRMIAEAISGSRQHWKKSRLPLTSWYSGRYLPARSCQKARGHAHGEVLLRATRHTLAHHPHGRAFDLLTYTREAALAWSQQLQPRMDRASITPGSPEEQVILQRLERVSHHLVPHAELGKIATNPYMYGVRFSTPPCAEAPVPLACEARKSYYVMPVSLPRNLSFLPASGCFSMVWHAVWRPAWRKHSTATVSTQSFIKRNCCGWYENRDNIHQLQAPSNEQWLPLARHVLKLMGAAPSRPFRPR